MLTRILLISAALAIVGASQANASSPTGFETTQVAPSQPRGFSNNAQASVKWVKQNSRDDDIVTLRGRFTQYINGDNYVFTDLNGDSIEAELDSDHNWGHVVKDELFEITAKVDKDVFSMYLEVISAKKL